MKLIGLIVVVGAAGYFLYNSDFVPKVKDQTMSSEEAALSLNLDTGSEIILRQTVLGVGGKIVDFLGGEDEERTVTIKEWTPKQSASFHWSITQDVETEASAAARKEYNEKYLESPVGEIIPDEPKPEYETKTREGDVTTTALDSAKLLLLPTVWSETDQEVYSDNSIIWLSSEQYKELVETRKTSINIGLFDDSLSSAVKFTDEVRNVLNRIQQKAEEASEAEDLLEVRAEQRWGEHALMIDGKLTRVRVINAENWFGKYKILANPDNPIILEVSLNPASQGSINIFSKENLLQAFLGYEVAKINP